jgi:hypothetical protein
MTTLSLEVLTMFKSRSCPRFLLAAALVCWGTSASADPFSFSHTDWGLLRGNIFLTEGSDNIFVVKPDGSAVKIAAPTWRSQQMALGVITSGSSPIIRTLGQYNNSENYGVDYDLNGTYLGGHYVQTAGGAIHDGTSDGTTYNYELDAWVNSGVQNVYRCNTDWSNATVLFSIPSTTTGPGFGGFTGITYDPSGGGSLWVSTENDNNGGLLERVDLSGHVILSVPLEQYSNPNWPHIIQNGNDLGTVGMYRPSALMRDPGTGYLWVVTSANGMGWFAGYDPSGNFVGALSWSSDTLPVNFYNVNVAGGEIAVPEPATIALLLAAVIGLLAYAWQRRTA